jgi:hypothetical protein
LARIFLALYALLFVAFGVYVFVQAPALAENVGYGAPNANGLYEMRSNYGGVSIGIGLMCLAGAMAPKFQRPALFTIMAYTGGYALGRIISLPIDGIPSATLIAYGIFEAVSALIAYGLLSKQAKSSL